MSNRNTVLAALVKHGTSTYDDLEKHTGMARNNLRWTMNAAKAEKLVEQTEDPLENSVAWKITPAGRIALERAQPKDDEKSGSKPKEAKKQHAKGPQPKVGLNNIGNSAPESLVEESGTPAGGAVVSETRAGCHGPEAVQAAEPVVSDEKETQTPAAKQLQGLAFESLSKAIDLKLVFGSRLKDVTASELGTLHFTHVDHGQITLSKTDALRLYRFLRRTRFLWSQA